MSANLVAMVDGDDVEAMAIQFVSNNDGVGVLFVAS
jgi:hypothetical protein